MRRKLTFIPQLRKCERTMTNCDSQMAVVGGGGEFLDNSSKIHSNNNRFNYLFFKRRNNIIPEMEILPLTGKINTLTPHAAKNASRRALKCPPVCVKSVLFDGCVFVCVLCSVLPCCEGEVGTAGWLKLFSSVWESSGGDWGGSCPGVNWTEGETT